VSKTIDDARRLIESRLAEIRTEAGQLERVLSALGETSASRPRRKVTKTVNAASDKGRRSPRSGPAAGRRATRGQRGRQLLAEIEESPGARPSELAESIGIRPTQVSVLLAKARADKLIVKSGKGYALRS
jgi:hypothetical protein